MKRLHSISILKFTLLILLFSTGCTHVSEITTNVSPTAIAAERSDARLLVIFTPELLEASSTSLLDGTLHEYEFKAGDSLRSALTRATEVVYRDLSFAETKTVNNEFNQQIIFDLNYFDMNISLSLGLFKSGVKATCNVSVNMEFFDGTGHLIERRSASGNGISSHKTGSPDKAKDYFSEAAQKAIQQLADNVANILM